MGRKRTFGKSLSKVRVEENPVPAHSVDAVPENNQRYRDLIDFLPLSVFEIDRNTRVVFTNRQAIRDSGYTPEELTGMTAIDFFIPGDKDRVIENIGKIFNGEKVQGNEYTVIRKNGSTFPAIIYSSPKIQDGHIVGITGIFVDISERKIAERDLRESEAKYRTLLENLPQKIFQKDLNSIYLSCNQNFAQELGLDPEEIKGKTDYDFYSKELAEKFIAHDKKVFKSGETQILEWVQIRHGKEQWHHAVKTPIKDKYNNIKWVLGISWDITETKHAQLKVEEQLQFQKTLLDTIPNPVFYKDIDGRYTGCNEAFMAFLGKTSKEIIGKTVFDMAPEDIAGKYFQTDSELFTTQGKQCYEWKVKGKNGEIRDVIFNKAILKDINGKPQGLIGVISDITERKQAEEKIRRHEHKLEKLVAERSMELRSANEKLQTELIERKRISGIFQARAQLFEYAGKHTLDELLEETLNSVERLTDSRISFYHFVNPDQKTLALQNWSTQTKSFFCNATGKGAHYEIAKAGVWVDCFHQRKPVIHNDYELLSHKKGLPFGHAVVVRELVIPVFRGHKIVAILGVGNKPTDYDQRDVEIALMVADLAWDITEQKRAEEKIRALNETLEQRVANRTAELENRARQLQQLALELSDAEDRERRRIASILHDDLQQELSYIKLELGILQKNATKKVQQRLYVLEKLIGGSIEKSRNLSYEINPPALHRCGLLAALKGLARDMKNKFGLKVKMRTQPGAEPASLVLASILYRSARELLFNVVKHAGVDSAVVDVRHNNGTLHLRVEDNGKGFTYDSGRSALDRGGGFGLCSIEDRINFLGGGMKVITAPGKGCCVELNVPMDVSGKPAIPAPSSEKIFKREGVDLEPVPPIESAIERRSQIRILLADDHQLMREALVELLNDREGMIVVGQANNGSEVIQLAGKLKPNVILMDISMQGLDGFQATAQITRDYPDIRIIGLSVDNDAFTCEKMLHAGASACLTKTGSPITLIEVIQNVHYGNK